MAYVALFFSLAFLVNLAFVVTCLAAAAAQYRVGHPGTLRRCALALATAIGTFVAASVVMFLAFRYDTFGVLWAVYEQNDAFNAHTGRSYGKWLLWNPILFTLFSGGPVIALAVVGAVRDVVRMARGERRFVPFAACFWIVWTLLWLSGKNLGEVERLWVFLMPIAAIVGVASLRVTADSARRLFWLLPIQAVHVIVYRSCFDVYGAAGYFHKLLGM